MQQTLSYYYIFYITAKEKNISKAASCLFISQPAVSRAISNLEQNLGTTLFKRSSRGVSLTSDGQILFAHIKTAFEAIEAGEKKLQQIHSLETGQIRIGASTTLCKYILLPDLKQYMERYPNIQIRISCQSTNQTLKLLEEDSLDIGLICSPRTLKNISYYPLINIQDTFVAAPTYLKHFSPSILDREADFLEQSTILMLDRQNLTRQYIEQYFQAHQLSPSHLLEISTMDLLIDFAKIGLGAAFVIENFIEEELQNQVLVKLPLSNPIPFRTAGYAYHKKSPLSPASEAFLSLSLGIQ